MKTSILQYCIMPFIGLCMLVACTPTPAPLPTLASLPATNTPLAAASVLPPKALPAWEILSSSIGIGQIEQWQFDAVAGDAIRVRAVPIGNVTLSLRNSSGDVINSGEEVSLTVAENGLYTVEVQTQADSIVTYDIGLAYTDRPNPNSATARPQIVGVPTPTPAYNALGSYQGQLAPQAPINAQLDSETPHIYTINGTAGETVSIVLNAPGDPFLRLFDPSAQLVAMDDNSGTGNAAHIRNVQFAENGLYSVQVTMRDAGAYELALVPGVQALIGDTVITPTPTVSVPYIAPTLGALPADERLQDHVPVLGELETASDFGRYSFYALPGEVVTVGLAPYETSGLRPVLEVFGPEGNAIANAAGRSSNAGGAAIARTIAIPEEGAYLIIVTGESGTFGPYTIGVGRGTTYQERYMGEPQPDETISGTIATYATRHAYRINLRAGNAISVSINPAADSQLDPLIEIADSEGNMLYQDDNGGSNRAALIRYAQVEGDGMYWLRVSDASAQQIGGYTLRWRLVDTEPTETAIPLASTIMSINDTVSEGEYGFYSFYGQAGQQVQVRVISQDEASFDPVAVLLNPQGVDIAEGDDSQNSLNPMLFATLLQDGTYTVRVNGYLSGGDFELLVSLLLTE